MFEDGLHNRVDVYYLNRNLSNRTKKDDIKIADVPVMTNVSCRIIKKEKVLFANGLELFDGCTIKDKSTGIVYEIREGNQVRGIRNTHHSSYKIRIKSESERHG